jgi:hypothetical protein
MWPVECRRKPEVSCAPPNQRSAIYASSGLLATNLPLHPRGFQLPVTLRVDLLLAPSQRFLRCDVARRAVQPNIAFAVEIFNSIDAGGRNISQKSDLGSYGGYLPLM